MFSPKEMMLMSNAFTHSKIELQVLGDGWGGASGCTPRKQQQL